MKKIMFLVAALVLSVAAMAQVQEAYPSYVQVEGYAEMEVEPDEFYLSIVINERDSKGKITVETQQRQMIEALNQLGIDVEKQLKMSDMNSVFFKKNNTLTTASYELKLNTSKEVAAVYAALDGLGISDISVNRVDNTEIERYKEQVRAEAMANAKKTAEALAGAVGQKIGKCFYIYDISGYRGVARYADSAMYMSANSEMKVAEPTLEFKKIQVTHTVQTKFVLE